MLPMIPSLQEEELGPPITISHNLLEFLSSTLIDLYVVSTMTILFAFYGLHLAYKFGDRGMLPLRHANGDRKSKEELQDEALEEDFCSWVKRYVGRFYFPCQLLIILQVVLIIIKFLARLYEEIGVLHETVKPHPLFWIALTINGSACCITTLSLEHVGSVLWKLREAPCPTSSQNKHSSFCQYFYAFIGYKENDIFPNDQHQDLSESLLHNTCHSFGNDSHSADILLGNVENAKPIRVIHKSTSSLDIPSGVDPTRDASDVNSDAQYKAGWMDLVFVCHPDVYLIILAFVFLILAAVCQVLIPRYTGEILDSLANYASSEYKNDKGIDSLWSIPMTKLLTVSILGGIFAGVRGAIFALTGGRMNVRLRVLLMDSLLCQDIGFFDVTKMDEIIRRLASDTMLVGDQVTLNINIFLRSVVQIFVLLIFMTMLSWQLTLLAVISAPIITTLSKFYDFLIRDFTKLMQKKLAHCNGISETVLASIKTVRAFGAEISELREFEQSLCYYLDLNTRLAQYYIGYSVVNSVLHQLVMVVVLFYGGLLTLTDGKNQITSGQLVSFLLYISSLMDAFGSIGAIWTSLPRAVQGADRIFELIHRKPKRNVRINARERRAHKGALLGKDMYQTDRFRSSGLHPLSCNGQISFKSISLFYPSRPQRQVLRDLTFTAYPGQVVALVGMSVRRICWTPPYFFTCLLFF
jgi:hypothetical protein